MLYNKPWCCTQKPVGGNCSFCLFANLQFQPFSIPLQFQPFFQPTPIPTHLQWETVCRKWIYYSAIIKNMIMILITFITTLILSPSFEKPFKIPNLQLVKNMSDIKYKIELKSGRYGPEFFFKIDLPVIVLTSDPVADCNLGFLPHIGGQHGAKYWSVWFKIRLRSGIHSNFQKFVSFVRSSLR